MKLKFTFFTLTLVVFLISSCKERKEQAGVIQLKAFDFYTSSSDGIGIIQLPDIIENDIVKSIKVLNEPQGNYEIFVNEGNETTKTNYIIYTASSKELENDRIDFSLTTNKGLDTHVTAHLVLVKDGVCEGSNPSEDYNLLLQNHFLTLKVGEDFSIQLDGFDPEIEASASLLPKCSTIQDYGIRNTLLTGLDSISSTLLPSYQLQNKASNMFHDMFKKKPIQFTNRETDGALFISGRIPEGNGPKIYRFVYNVFVPKLNKGRFLHNFKPYPESNWEWEQQLTVHKYGLITLNIKP